jgi:hypothetical protein
MSLDISPLEQAVPRATALLKRLSSVQAEAFASQSGGPDIQAMTERMRAASKSAGVLATGSGTARFKTPEAESAFVDPISQANEESLKRRAAREAYYQQQHEKNVYERMEWGSAEAEHLTKVGSAWVQDRLRMDAALADSARRTAQRELAEADAQQEAISQSMQRAAQERVAAREAMDEGLLDSARRTAQRELAEADAQQEAISQSMQRAAQERVAAQEQIADIRRQQAQVRASGEYSRANPFQQQVLAVQRLNQLLAERRKLLGNGDDVAIARATLAVNRQVQAVRNLRDELTVGTEGFRRLGNTSADSLGGYARFGLAAQQVGYQVQDFAVQVTSGTNAMVAFSQQASQLLGFFGGFRGALAGAALSVGILAFRLLDSGNSAIQQAEAVKKATDAWEEYSKQIKEIRFGNLPESEQAGSLEEQIQRAKNRLSELGDLQNRLGNTIAKRNTDYFGSFAEGYERVVFPTLEQQLKYEKAVKDAREAGRSAPSPLLDEFGGGAIFLPANLISGTDALEKLLAQVEETAAKGSLEVAELADRLRDLKKARLEAVQSVKDQGADAGRTDLQRIASLKQQQAEAEKLGQQETVEYQTRKNQIGELERTQRASLDRLSRDRQLIGKDEFDKLAIYRREWLKSEEGSVAEAEALNRVKEQEAALKKTADAYKDQLDPLRAQKRELELINNLVNTQVDGQALLTRQEADLLRLRMQDERERALRTPEALRIDTGASFAGMRNTDQSATTLISIQQQMLAALKTLVFQGAN